MSKPYTKLDDRIVIQIVSHDGRGVVDAVTIRYIPNDGSTTIPLHFQDLRRELGSAVRQWSRKLVEEK